MCFAGGGINIEPEWLLAAIVKRDLGVDVEPAKLRSFVEKNWRDVAALAHAIHEPKPTEGKTDG